MGETYFVSGIDTGVGKTIATGLMARHLLAKGCDVITMKMVQTGNVGYSEDLDLHRAIMRKSFAEDAEGLTSPQIFAFPSSPELSARLEGKTVDCEAIAAAAEKLATRHEILLVEGAGGLDVPLTPEKLSVDFAAEHAWPLILVSCGKLGSINHTLMSLEVALSRGMRVAGIVYNWYEDADETIDADTPAYIAAWLERKGLKVPIVRIGELVNGDPLPDVDFSSIFKEGLK